MEEVFPCHHLTCSVNVRKEIASSNYTHVQELAAVNARLRAFQNVGQICTVCHSREFELKQHLNEYDYEYYYYYYYYYYML